MAISYIYTLESTLESTLGSGLGSGLGGGADSSRAQVGIERRHDQFISRCPDFMLH